MKTIQILYMILLVLFLDGVTTQQANAQKKERTRLKAYYEKLTNNEKKISIAINTGSGKKMVGVQEAEILLSTIDGDENIQLATLVTDENGEAVLLIEPGYVFPRDEDGFSNIRVVYAGNDTLRSARRQVKFKDLNLDLSFDIIDSVKYVTVTAFELDSALQRMPAAEVDLNVGVQRLYSTLILQKIETDKNGIGTIEFPDDIPGDSIGTINVVINTEDDDDYGTVFKEAQVNWGTLVNYHYSLTKRSLFGEKAPLWMIISVFVILTGAWYHFILAIFKVLEMKSLAQKSRKLKELINS